MGMYIFFSVMGNRCYYNLTCNCLKLQKLAGRFTRHLNIISIDSFDDDTLSKIFCSITDWHFGSGFDPSFTR